MTTQTAARRHPALRVANSGWTRLAVIALIGALAVWKLDLGQVLSAFRVSSWGLLALAALANLASVGVKCVAWKGVVDAMPEIRGRARMRDLVGPLFVGYLFNAALAARVGEIVKVLLVKRRLDAHGQPASSTALLGTVVAENLIGTVTWVAMVVVIGLFLPLPTYAWIATATLGIVCLSVVVVALLRRPARPIPPWLNTGPLWARASRAFSRLWGAVHQSHIGLRDPRQAGVVVSASLGTWIAQWAGIWLTLEAFGLDRVGWGGAGLLLVTITLAQAFPVLPGNLVVFQAAAVVPLTASYGVGAAEALAFAVVLQATEAVIGVVIGLLFLVAEGVGFGQLRRQAEEDSRKEEPGFTIGHGTDTPR